MDIREREGETERERVGKERVRGQRSGPGAAAGSDITAVPARGVIYSGCNNPPLPLSSSSSDCLQRSTPAVTAREEGRERWRDRETVRRGRRWAGKDNRRGTKRRGDERWGEGRREGTQPKLLP